MKSAFFAALVVVLAVSWSWGQDDGPGPKTLEQKASFIVGHNIVDNFRTRGIEIDIDALIQGIRSAAEGKELPMTPEEVTAVMQKFEALVVARQESMVKALAEENQANGERFLQQHATQEGVQKLPSGIQFRVIRQGHGDANPAIEDSVRVHYTGRFIDGEVFDSSVGGEPAVFRVGGLIRGMTESLLKMKTGDKWEIAIPADLAYGQNAPPEIGPNQVLVFELELMEIIKR